LWLLAAMLVASCNPPADYALVGSAYVPAVHGEIKLEKIDKEQMLVVALLDHLPPPEKIELGLTHYIVWFAAPGENPVRKGPLDYDPEAQIGRASIPTTLRELEIMITAENSETPNHPSDLLVASQKIREN
jgi:hypothetical protein